MTIQGMLRQALACLALVAAMPGQAADLWPQIQKSGMLRVGLEGTYAPFGYQDENGELVGFDVDIARALAAKLGLKPDFQPTKWEGILAALDVGRFDVVINQVSLSEERRKVYDFSQPYTYSGLQLIIRKDDAARIKGVDDLAGKKVGVLLGTNHERWLRDHAPKAEIRTYEEDATRNQDLLVGRIDAVLNDRLIVGMVLKQYGGKLVAAGAAFDPQQEAVALRKGSPRFLAAIDQAFDALRQDGSLARISEKWFGADVTHP